MTISLEDVSFAYPDTPGNTILHIPHWQVNACESVFIHGPSGGGKSTLLNLLSGILQPSSGALTVLGKRLDTLSARQRDQFRANHIGYVFQQFNLIPYLSAIENIRLASYFCKSKKSVTQNEIESVLHSLELSERLLKTQACKLSIGQQQRVAIARSLINKPELFIADEPTSSLDKKNRDNFMKILLPLVETHKMTLVFVSHDLSLSHYFQRVDELENINQLESRQTEAQ